MITVALNMVNKVRNEEDKDTEEPNAYVKVFRCFSFLVILLFVMAETMYRDNATLGAMSMPCLLQGAYGTAYTDKEKA